MTPIVVSVSGGRSSAYMAEMMLARIYELSCFFGDDVGLVFVFANTGMEHDDTLRFMHDVDQKLLGGRCVWVESVTYPGEKRSSGHRITTFEDAYRASQWREPGHPFASMVSKYGVPNRTHPHCTRELKLNPVKSYLRSLGLAPQQYRSAVGIRIDEPVRLKSTERGKSLLYPLADFWPTEKDDVIARFESEPWDLAVPEYLGNCIGCFKKSDKKLAFAHSKHPDTFEFTSVMETEHGRVGAEFKKDPAASDRVFFRQNRSTNDMKRFFNTVGVDDLPAWAVVSDGGCSESCEAFL